MGELKTVLYVQRYPDGGSITSLLDLVRGLDPSRYRAVVAFASPNAFLDEFADAGATVEIFQRHAPDPQQPVTVSKTQPGDAAADAVWWRGARRVLRRAVRYDLRSALYLALVSRRHRADIIHANNDIHVNRDAALASALVRRPYVNHARGYYEPPSSFELGVDKLVARRAARLFFISQAVARWHAPLRVPVDRTEVIDNPFDVEGLRVAPSADVAAGVGMAAGDRMVLHIGRITPMKGQDVLLRALPALLEQDPAVLVVLVGAATDPQGTAYEAELRTLVEELGVTDRVVFAGPRRDVAELLAICDVAVHSSTEPEPFGRVIVEAMAAGRPIVGADAGGVPEIIEEGVTGLLVPPSDPAALASALGRLLGDPEEAAAMGRRAAAATDQRFGMRAHAARVQATYDRLIARR